MAYWLANTSTLLFLLQRSLKASSGTAARKPPTPTSLFGRMTQVLRWLWYIYICIYEFFSIYICMCTFVSTHVCFGTNVRIYIQSKISWALSSDCWWCFLGFPFFFCQSFSWSNWYSPPCWGEISRFAFQAAACCICGEDIWDYPRQCEEGLVTTPFFVYPGIVNLNFPALYLYNELSPFFPIRIFGA